MEKETVKTAYTLLPPPLAAIPAKYWTSISLWLHSYTVARTFQELLKLADEKEGPNQEEAFIIGFLHDLAQKLGKTPTSLRQTYKWVLEKLTNNLGWTPREARKVAKVLETNPAENIRRTDYADPILPPRVWKLLMLADELQGSIDAISWAMRVKEALKNEFGKSFYISVFAVNLPQPFVGSKIWEQVEEKLEEDKRGVDQSDYSILAVASIQGLVVLSKEPLGKITISWDEIIGRSRGADETDVLSVDDIGTLKKHINERCTNSKEAKTRKYKQEESRSVFKKFVGKYCDKKKRKDERAGTYRLLLHYYGSEKDEELATLYLPRYAKDATINIEITGVKYADGNYLCPICGARHREGFVAGIVGTVSNARSEKWSRFLTLNISKNLNQMLNEKKPIRICPLCMLDVLLASRRTIRGYAVYYTLSLQTPMPVPVLHEIAGLMHKIISKFYEGSSSPSTPNTSNIDSMSKSPIDIVAEVKRRPIDILHNYAGVSISTNGSVRFKGDIDNLKLQDKIIFTALAGLLAYYGLYPVMITVGYPPSLVTSSNKLISYEVVYPLYDYAPNTEDNRFRKPVTPYVASTLVSLPLLYRDRENPERRRYARHIEEILGFSPEYSPLTLLYSNPDLYSYVSNLINRFMGGGSNG